MTATFQITGGGSARRGRRRHAEHTEFWGRVIRGGRIQGKKKIRTDEPSEQTPEILETLVECDAGQALPLGLRVDSYVQREVSAAGK